MTEQSRHLDVAGYALGALPQDERAVFTAHLADCDACRRELDDLMSAVDLLALVDPDPAEAPQGLEARTMLAVERTSTGARTRRRPRLGFASRGRQAAALAAACVGLAVAVGLVLSGGDEDRAELVEGAAELRGGDRIASLSLVATGIGRVVELRTSDLPILPKGEYYELWFVGPGDRRGEPNRISAGTFHPDENGHSAVTFAAAVEPRKYRRMAVTAEPGDGDPSPHGRDVLSGTIDLR